ncbi:MAG TPA: double-strand break repair protein AddB [Caulobacteraceae bacterium]
MTATFLFHPAPRWFSIEASRPFLADLAVGLAQALGPLGPEGAASALVLLPTRRAGRDLAQAFVEAAPGPAALLPQIRALGDLEEGEPPFEPGDAALELPPAITAERRRFELARLVVENEGLLERRLDAGAALELADALAAFLDACEMEEVGDPELVETLVEGDLAKHWQVAAQFLGLALTTWPKRLDALGLMDITARRVALLRHLARRWSQTPPSSIVIAAGSTGAAPAAADLLAVIAGLPQGGVVIPGLDRSLADEAWDEVGEQHPQGGLKRLLARAGVPRFAVKDWGGAPLGARGRWRQRLINEALRPAETTSDWLGQIERLRAEGAAAGMDPIAEGLAGLTVIASRTEEEEAGLAALLLREVLETPGKTCALVTPDAALARRVSARLTRWNISADSSAGAALAASPVGVLASLIARGVADPTDPVTQLAILKHPFTRLRLQRRALERSRETLECEGLRGPRASGWDALLARLRRRLEGDDFRRMAAASLAADLAGAMELVALLRDALGTADGAWTGETTAAARAARALAGAMEVLARGPAGEFGELWSSQAGETAGALISALIGESEGLPAVTRHGFSELLDGLLARELVRSGGATHPRLRILGVLEARLLRADRLILAGLEEGVWPRAAPIDPFLSRPMRERLGLPPPERRLGLSAHDFAQAAAAPEVVLLRSERRDGAPTVASRWLWRLEVLAKGAKVALPCRDDALAWTRRLDAPLAEPPPSLAPAPRPRPKPPLAARPRRMGVTSVERWVRDPYAIYARYILKLVPLEVPDQSVEALARGTAVHRAIERFAIDHPGEVVDGAAVLFERLLVEELAAAGVHETRMARERALAANVAPWIAQFERGRRPGARILVETRGALVFEAAGGEFTITARADRLEHRGEAVDILDFKTGAPPSNKQVRAGLAPQLTLTAAILAAGGFKNVEVAPAGELLYVRVSGGRVPATVESRAGAHESAELAAAALAGLKRRVAWFDDPSTPYPSWATPQFIGRWGGDYDHLARLWEWHVIGDSDAAVSE